MAHTFHRSQRFQPLAGCLHRTQLSSLTTVSTARSLLVSHTPFIAHNGFNRSFAFASSCHDAFKCAASEVRLVWPVLRYCVSTVVWPTKTLDKEVASSMALGAVIDKLRAIKVKKGGPADNLAKVVRERVW